VLTKIDLPHSSPERVADELYACHFFLVWALVMFVAVCHHSFPVVQGGCIQHSKRANHLLLCKKWYALLPAPASLPTLSACSGIGMKKLFPAVVRRIRDPGGDTTKRMRAMLSQSW
jgi:hypothetical protein